MKYLLLFFLIIASLTSGCQETNKTSSSNDEEAAIPVTDTAFNTSCPYLTHNSEGVPVLSWVQENQATQATQIYYAVYIDSIKKFGKPEIISSAANVEPHGEDMPKIIYQKNGNMFAVYSIKNPQPGNPYTGAVYYTRSFDGGEHWTPAHPLITDSSQSFDQRYFDVALLPNDEIGMIWLNNSIPTGSTLFYASTNGKEDFSNKTIIARHTCQCCRTDLLIDAHGNINVAWRNIFNDSIRDMAYAVSKDTGKTFSSPVRISADNWAVDGCPHTGPSMAQNNDGLHFTWFTMGGGGGVYYCHKKANETFFSPRETVSGLPSAKHPQIVALPDNDLAIVWDEGAKYKSAFHQRIGLQLRGPEGLLITTSFLTPDSANASFPQIKILNNQTALLAYTQANGEKQQVRYQLVQLKP